MWKNYIVTAFRNLIRYKGFSLINILGLAIGMAVSILIFLWIQNELSYDKFHEKSENIYRLCQTQYYSSGPLTTTCMPGPISDDIREEVPEILNSFMFYRLNGLFSYNDQNIDEEFYLADPQIFEMLDFDFLKGNPENVFDDLNSMVITDEMAEKYFGSENPIGKVITINQEHDFKVTGVFEKLPANSSFQMDFCIPFKYIENVGFTIDRYGWNSYYVYVELHEETDYKEVNEKIKDYLLIKSATQDTTGQYDSDINLYLFPFEKMHLHSVKGSGGDIQYIYIFAAVAIFIIIIACINFMNLATARSARRSREIGIRKTVGATRSEIIRQFFGESLVMTIIAFIIAIFLVVAVLPQFNLFAETELGINLLDGKVIIGLLSILVFAGLLAGSYPALYLSGFQPVGVLKGVSVKGKGGAVFRRVLVVFQFTLSIILIIATLGIFNQMKYMQNKKLGINKDNVVINFMNGQVADRYESMKAEMLQNPYIEYVSRGNSLPFWIGSNSGGFDWEGSDGNNDVLIGFTFVDFDYDKTMGLKIKNGRFYDNQFATDTSKIVINEKLARIISDGDVVGKWLSWGDDISDRMEIIGVVEDFHHLPMSHEIDPLVMVLNPENGNYLFSRINPANQDAAIDYMGEVWEKFNPNFPFESRFLDLAYEETYQGEKRIGELFRVFTLLAIFISSLGLFGLAAYIAEQRTREISTRKVFGADTGLLVYIMTRDFMKWVLIANVIAIPVAWCLLKLYLENYVYHAPISVWIFVLAVVISLGIALLTVSLHAFRTANRNPSDALRYE